jgi:hypothetical protein
MGPPPAVEPRIAIVTVGFFFLCPANDGFPQFLEGIRETSIFDIALKIVSIRASA